MSGQPVVQELQLLQPPPPPPPAADIQSPQRPVQPPPNGGPGVYNFKNKLQEYTQKSAIQLPVYNTINEGTQHAPWFRSTVLVDGKSYKSPSTFPQRKLAEQDAARVALDDVSQKIRVDGRPLVCEDTIFCKSILNEYAVKTRVEKPTYHTMQPEGKIPVFVSSVNFNGISYNGGTGKNKKEAEQLAARAAILSILDSDTTQTINRIIKSKFKLYAALNKVEDNGSVLRAALPTVNTGDGSGVQLNKRKEAEVTDIDINLPLSGIGQSSLDELARIQSSLGSNHAFKKPGPKTPIVEMAPPIEFVSAGSEQLQLSSTSLELPFTSGVEQNQKSKKKAKKSSEIDAQMPTGALPLHQFPSCSVTK